MKNGIFQISPLSPLRPGRAHEAYGAGSLAFAAILAGRQNSNVIWITEHSASPFLPAGIMSYCDPSKILAVHAPKARDVLATTEDSLRSGAVPLIITETPHAIGLTEGRRLQLAAKSGNSTALLLTSSQNGSAASETRWKCEPIFDPDHQIWAWELEKNKSSPCFSWKVQWDHQQQTVKTLEQKQL